LDEQPRESKKLSFIGVTCFFSVTMAATPSIAIVSIIELGIPGVFPMKFTFGEKEVQALAIFF